MVNIDDFKYVLALWNNYEIPDLIQRDIKIDLDSNKIVSIAGSRRSGKTYVMFQCMLDLRKRGVRKDNIVYVNFENERMVGIRASDLDNMLIAHKELFNPTGNVYVFLDEIQVVENWDKWVRKIFDTGKYHIILTGSSSELLSSEIATSLAGRNLSYTVYPFSFKEYLNARGMKINKMQKYSVERGTILQALNDFLEYGSFPEIAMTLNVSRKLEILSSYFDAIFFRDLVRRYSIREVGELNIFLKILASSYASLFSSVKSLNYFRSMGRKISRVTLLHFLDESKSVFLVYLLEKFDKSVRKSMSLKSKTYIVDIGISRLFADIDRGRALENAVFLELLRRKGPTQNINYLKLKSGKEVDFIFGGKKKEIMQVSYELSSKNTRSRETAAIVEAAKGLGLQEAKVITYNFEGEEHVDGILIKFIPFWIWALPDMQ
ncbi:MAG: ATP-binding protein [Thermoplasmata archaeon]